MSRPNKKGLSYFPLDTNFLSDRKIQRLAREYQHAGICTYLTLLCEIYRTTGYYIPYNRELIFDIAFTLQLEEKLVEDMVVYCLDIHLFDKSLFEQVGVLSSAAIQERFKLVRKRGGVIIDPVLELAGKNPPFASLTGVNVTKTTPKGKGKGKEKESKNEIKLTDENEKRKPTTTDEERMAELINMYNAATTGGPDV